MPNRLIIRMACQNNNNGLLKYFGYTFIIIK